MKELIANAKPNTAFLYAVYKEHTLGYLFKLKEGNLLMGILHGSVINGGYSVDKGPQFIQPYDLHKVRKATEQDFDEHYISLPNDFYDLNG